MDDGIGLAEVLLGLPGFRVLDVVEIDGEGDRRRGDDGGSSVLPWLRCAGGAAGSDACRRSRSGLLRSAGPPALVEAEVALPGAVVSGADVD